MRGRAAAIRASHSSGERNPVAKHHHARVWPVASAPAPGGRLRSAGRANRPAVARAQAPHWVRPLHGQLVQVLLQRGLHGIGGHVFVPARVAHGLQHHRGRKARLGLLDDPAAQLWRDGLGRRLAGAGGAFAGRETGPCSNPQTCRWDRGKTSVGLGRNTRRSGSDAACHTHSLPGQNLRAGAGVVTCGVMA